jgi:hypothetical protein
MINISSSKNSGLPMAESDLDDLIEAAITKNVLAGDKANKQGDFQLAEQLYSHAIHLAEIKFGAKAAAVGYLLAILADLYELQNRKDDAVVLHARVKEILNDYVKVPER